MLYGFNTVMKWVPRFSLEYMLHCWCIQIPVIACNVMAGLSLSPHNLDLIPSASSVGRVSKKEIIIPDVLYLFILLIPVLLIYRD